MSGPRHHTLDIYGADLHLATTRPQWRSLARRIKAIDAKAPDSAGCSTFATFHPNDGGVTVPVIVLWIDVAQHKTFPDLIDTIAHEASHAAGQLLEHIGHQPAGTDEPHAYLVGWLTRWLWENAEWSE